MQIPTAVNIEGRDYEIINFNSKRTNKSEASRGIALAQGFIAISGTSPNYRIYNTQSGEPIIKGRFPEFKDALQFALWIEKAYADYFDIWKEYPQADLLAWCRYSVSNGMRLFEIREILNKLEVITSQDIARAWKGAI